MFYPNIPGQNKRSQGIQIHQRDNKNPPIKYRNIKTIEIISKKSRHYNIF